MRREAQSLREQVRHPGPVWLDQPEVAPLAPYGFGAAVRQALGERRLVLHQLGIAPSDPDRVTQLRELQRRAVGEGVAARLGQAFLAQAPSTFRGRLRPLQEHDAYAVVSDGARFVLVPASPELRVHVGKTVVSHATRKVTFSCARRTETAACSGPPQGNPIGVFAMVPSKVRRVRVSTRLTVALRDRLSKYSAASGLSERAVLEDALRQYLDGTSDGRLSCGVSTDSTRPWREARRPFAAARLWPRRPCPCPKAQVEPDLDDLDYGEWAGKTEQQAAAAWPTPVHHLAARSRRHAFSWRRERPYGAQPHHGFRRTHQPSASRRHRARGHT